MGLTHNCPGLNPSTFSDAPTVFVVDGGKMMRKMHASSFAELVTMVANLRRWTATMAASVRWPPEPPADTDTFVQSLRFRTSDAMSV